ncbi:hypothetical protein PVAP13_1KG147905 [Panicum virgatum]|uniref:Uncharacterized protein n=1 Tax=Panicum virgatum TaxID=38727 RepID=A0A8T0X8B3_PANVG|nr:hypothetical protein PVAP13_1KG147905 [Panicum virgatum]
MVSSLISILFKVQTIFSSFGAVLGSKAHTILALAVKTCSWVLLRRAPPPAAGARSGVAFAGSGLPRAGSGRAPLPRRRSPRGRPSLAGGRGLVRVVTSELTDVLTVAEASLAVACVVALPEGRGRCRAVARGPPLCPISACSGGRRWLRPACRCAPVSPRASLLAVGWLGRRPPANPLPAAVACCRIRPMVVLCPGAGWWCGGGGRHLLRDEASRCICLYRHFDRHGSLGRLGRSF